MISNTVHVLGREYKIHINKYSKNSTFEKEGLNGWCCFGLPEIVIEDLKSDPNFYCESEEAIYSMQKMVLRHEIVHAFLNESGLNANAIVFDDSWAFNEEMVDWIALQGPKIYEAWKEAGAL